MWCTWYADERVCAEILETRNLNLPEGSSVLECVSVETGRRSNAA